MVETDNIFEKSSKISTEARKCGNQLYTRKNHDQDVHKNTLLQYSRSVAFAPKDSDGDELALAYSNRSALLMHLNQHERCLIDVDRALEITKSAELKTKLETRREKCVDAMRSSIDINSTLKKVSIDRTTSKMLPIITPSATIPTASKAITVKHDEKFGRHLVTTRDVKPGEMIVAEKGYVCFPIVKKRHLVCSHCLSFAWNGIPCDRCAFVIYCCEACKVEAWNEYHDVECGLLSVVPLSIFDKEDFLPYAVVALRLLIKAVKSEGVDGVFDEFRVATTGGNGKGVEGLVVDGKFRSDRFRSCANLLSHKDANKNEDSKSDLVISLLTELLFHQTSLFDSKKNGNDHRAKIISQLKNILKKLTDIVDDNVFEYQAFMCECNSLSECRTRCDASRGVVLAPFSSLINHSCNSNVSRVCLPCGKVVMFTVAPVKKGEQLFVSYGTVHTEEKVHRQQFLQKFFHFSCKCQACEENWPSDPQQAEMGQNEEALVMMKIMIEFKKHFPSVLKSSVMSASEDDWKFDKETLRHAVKLSELTYKHFENTKLASYYNLHYKNYMSTAFHALYGEEYTIPNNCYS